MTTGRLRRRQRWLATSLAAVLGLVLALVGWHNHSQHRRAQPHEDLLIATNRFERVRSFDHAAAGAGISTTRPQQIKVGIEIANIYNFSLANQTFMANGYYWLQWPETVQKWMDEKGIEPQQLIEFPNNIISYDFLVIPTQNAPKSLANGSHEQTFRFSGNFWTEELDFKHFPFQRLEIPIRLEIAPDDFSLNSSTAVSLVADPKQTDLLGSLIEIPGLQLKGGKLEPFVHYFSDDSSFATGTTARTFSQVRTLAVFQTHPITAIGQWLIPILIVMITVFVAPTVTGHLSDVRIAIPSAALLTLVVMQQTYESKIPQLSYLTFLDYIYLWCYAVTVALFVLFVWSANQYAAISPNDPEQEQRLATITARIRRIDHRFQLGSLVGTVVFVLWAFLR
ncbi:MAG: hypothetical protein EBZ51_07385 [Synechococcaceae bacterium WB9_2_112]|nr:hypothetical protein [Synechococcaceae bacterium WB9_2_112]